MSQEIKYTIEKTPQGYPVIGDDWKTDLLWPGDVRDYIVNGLERLLKPVFNGEGTFTVTIKVEINDLGWQNKLNQDLEKDFKNPWNASPHWIKRWIEDNIDLIKPEEKEIGVVGFILGFYNWMNTNKILPHAAKEGVWYRFAPDGYETYTLLELINKYLSENKKS